MTRRPISPSILCTATGALAALAAAAACLLAPPFVAASFALLAAAAICEGEYLRRREAARLAVIDEMIGEASSNAETGRQLAIFERDTKLFAHWYIELRGEEECDRAMRYSRDLTIAVLEPTPGTGAEEHEVSRELGHWLRAHKRNTDIVGYLGNARYIVIMPETAANHVAGFVQRLYRDVPHADIGVGAFPRDGSTYEALYGAAVARLGAQDDPGVATSAA